MNENYRKEPVNLNSGEYNIDLEINNSCNSQNPVIEYLGRRKFVNEEDTKKAEEKLERLSKITLN